MLVVALALSAAGTVEKYIGLAGVAAFAVYAGVAVLAWVALAPRFAGRLGDRPALALGAATVATLTALVAFAAVTLPFYVASPDGFTPADAGDKLEPYASILPHAPLVVPALAFGLAVVLAALPLVRDEWTLAAAFVPVIALPHLAYLVLDSISQGRLSFYQLIDSHGLGWLVFACAATALLLGRDRHRVAAEPGFYT